jgi:hypothetical protein
MVYSTFHGIPAQPHEVLMDNRTAISQSFKKAEKDMAKIQEIVDKLLDDHWAFMAKSHIRNPPPLQMENYYEAAFKISKVRGWKSYSELRGFLDSKHKWVAIWVRTSVRPFIDYITGDQKYFEIHKRPDSSSYNPQYFSFRNLDASEAKKRVPVGTVLKDAGGNYVAFRDDILPIVLRESKKFPEWKEDIGDLIKIFVQRGQFSTEADLRSKNIDRVPYGHK